MNSLAQEINQQIHTELIKENYRQGLNGYLKSVYRSCINQCYRETAGLNDDEKRCLLVCYRNQTLSLDSHLGRLSDLLL
jgi:hypothetical protein